MAKYISEVLVSEEQIKEMCRRLGEEISRDYEGKKLVLVCVLKGAVLFLADLMREIKVPLTIDFMSVSSYSGTKSSGVVKIIKDLDQEIEGKDILIVEDVVDTGLTLAYLKELLATRNPASVAVCTAFDKPECRKVEVEVEYTGLAIPNAFVVGYGLDYRQAYRELPYVAVLGDDGEEDVNEKK